MIAPEHGTVVGCDQGKQTGQGGRNSDNSVQVVPRASGSNGSQACRQCGRNKHATAQCDYKSWEGDPIGVKQQQSYINKDKCTYRESARGKACLAKFGVDYIPNLAWVLSGLTKDDYYAENRAITASKASATKC